MAKKRAQQGRQEVEQVSQTFWFRIRRDWLQPFGEAFLLAMVIRTFFFQPFFIPTPSMEPTIHGVNPGGDRVFANKLVYGIRLPFTERRLFRFRPPQPGDIVVFNTGGLEVRESEGKRYVKRVVAVGGQKVLIKDGHLFLDGVDSGLHRHTADKYYYSQEDKPGSPMPYARGVAVEVPPGHVFCLGDNSINSTDGRYWGFVPEKNVLGRAFVCWWPPRRIGILE